MLEDRRSTGLHRRVSRVESPSFEKTYRVPTVDTHVEVRITRV